MTQPFALDDGCNIHYQGFPMTWLQHTTNQLDQAGVQCRFSTSGHQLSGWIMPDGMGVFHQSGITLEVQPDTIVTAHTEGLRRARQGAANHHFGRHVLSYTQLRAGDWRADGDKWVKECRADLAGLTGHLSIHVTFKSGAAELMRFYTEFESEKHARAHGINRVSKGRVGGSLAEGEVVRTLTGRLTTSFPKIGIDTERKAGNTIKRVDQWLIQNALDEATDRGDEFNALRFKEALSKPQQADKDSAEDYLFGQQPVVIPSLLRELVPDTRTELIAKPVVTSYVGGSRLSAICNDTADTP